MFWKIYFWLLFTLLIPAFRIAIGDFWAWHTIDLITLFMVLIGLWAFVWKKKVFTQIFWQIFFVVSIFWEIFSTIFFSIPQEVKDVGFSTPVFYFLGTLTMIPLYIALYLYAFQKYKLNAYYPFLWKLQSIIKQVQNLNLFWKIYFWLLVIIHLPIYVSINKLSIFNKVGLIAVFLTLIGLWAFVWKKKVFTQIFWQIFFVVSIFWASLYYIFIPVSQEYINNLNLIILFGFIALYLYAFKSENIWETIKSTKYLKT